MTALLSPTQRMIAEAKQCGACGAERPQQEWRTEPNHIMHVNMGRQPHYWLRVWRGSLGWEAMVGGPEGARVICPACMQERERF